MLKMKSGINDLHIVFGFNLFNSVVSIIRSIKIIILIYFNNDKKSEKYQRIFKVNFIVLSEKAQNSQKVGLPQKSFFFLPSRGVVFN